MTTRIYPSDLQLIVYDLPLRQEDGTYYTVRLTLPAHLTPADADRVARFVKSLAFEGEPVDAEAYRDKMAKEAGA